VWGRGDGVLKAEMARSVEWKLGRRRQSRRDGETDSPMLPEDGDQGQDQKSHVAAVEEGEVCHCHERLRIYGYVYRAPKSKTLKTY
jgi:hypothetical protein